MEDTNRHLRQAAFQFVALLVTKIPYHITEHFVFTSIKKEKLVYAEITMQVATLAILNTKVPTIEDNMSSLLPGSPVAMTSRIAKLAHGYFQDVINVSTSCDLSVSAALDVVSAALLRLHSNQITDSDEAAVEVLLTDLLGTPLPQHSVHEIYRRASELRFPSLSNDPVTSSIIQAVIQDKQEELSASRQFLGSPRKLSLKSLGRMRTGESETFLMGNSCSRSSLQSSDSGLLSPSRLDQSMKPVDKMLAENDSKSLLESPSSSSLRTPARLSELKPTQLPVQLYDSTGATQESPSSGMFKLDLKTLRSQHERKLDSLKKLTPEELFGEKSLPSTVNMIPLSLRTLDTSEPAGHQINGSAPSLSYVPSWSDLRMNDSISAHDIPLAAKEKLPRTPPSNTENYPDFLKNRPNSFLDTYPNNLSRELFSTRNACEMPNYKERKLVKPSWAVDEEDVPLPDEFDRSKLSSIKKPGGRQRKTAPMRLITNADGSESIEGIQSELVSPKLHPRTSGGARGIRFDDGAAEQPGGCSMSFEPGPLQPSLSPSKKTLSLSISSPSSPSQMKLKDIVRSSSLGAGYYDSSYVEGCGDNFGPELNKSPTSLSRRGLVLKL